MELVLEDEEKNQFQTMLRFIQVKRNGSISQQSLNELSRDNKIECTRQGLRSSKNCGWVVGHVNAVETRNLSRYSRAECLSVCCVCVRVCECEWQFLGITLLRKKKRKILVCVCMSYRV